MEQQKGVALRLNADGRGTLVVDGVDLSHATSGVSIEYDAAGHPKVAIRLAAGRPQDIEIEGCNLSISGVSMPTRVELALWEFLRSKYGQEVDATTLSSTSIDYALRD